MLSIFDNVVLASLIRIKDQVIAVGRLDVGKLFCTEEVRGLCIGFDRGFDHVFDRGFGCGFGRGFGRGFGCGVGCFVRFVCHGFVIYRQTAQTKVVGDVLKVVSLDSRTTPHSTYIPSVATQTIFLPIDVRLSTEPIL